MPEFPNKWIYIDEAIDCITSGAILGSQIHIDTRDFYVNVIYKGNKNKGVKKAWKENQDKLFSPGQIFTLAKKLETESGGKGSWRFIHFNKLDERTGWHKYLRFYDIKGDNRYVGVIECGDQVTGVLSPDVLEECDIDKGDILCFIKDKD